MLSSSTVSFMLFLLLLVSSLHMNEALGAQIEIRKLKETMVMRRNLEGNGFVTSKIYFPPSSSHHCGGGKKFKNMAATTDRHDDQFSPLPGGDLSSCIRCVTTQRCVGVAGAPRSTYTCTTISKQCEEIPGP